MIAFLLALLVAAGAASSPVLASPDVAGVVDDGDPELVPAVVVTVAALAVPVRRELRHGVAPPGELSGRLHGVSVFRPPR